MIKVANISKSFGKNIAVNNISFEIKEGENFILLGTSGSGKTTMLRMINRLISPSSGTIHLNHKNVLDIPVEKLRREIGYVLQRNSLFPHYTVAENIAVVPKLLHWDKKKIEEKTVALLHKFRLPKERLSSYPNELSGGEAQRVNLARAIIANPAVLLMDEPFGALDPVTRISIRKEFSELEEFKKKTILMVTHDVQEAFELADRICLIDKGKIMQVGTPKELLFRPANDFVQQFFEQTHFQLSVTTTFLNDIWSYVNANEPNNSNIKLDFVPETSLWKVIEVLTLNKKNDTQVNVQLKNDDQNKRATLEELMNAFVHYKNNF